MIVDAPLADAEGTFRPSRQVAVRQFKSALMRWMLLGATCVGLLALATLIWTIVDRGAPWLSWHLITNMPSRKPEQAGLNSALFGTIWVISLTALISFPVGVGAGIFLGEYGTAEPMDTASPSQHFEFGRGSLRRLPFAWAGRFVRFRTSAGSFAGWLTKASPPARDLISSGTHSAFHGPVQAP